jgi:uncharacterized protein (DUF1697 family)
VTALVPPPRQVALLRAINVGGHTVKMDRLRALFEGLGLTGVSTFIASGNVVFDAAEEAADALERRIEAHLERSLGYPVATFVRSTAELAEVAEHRPFPDGHGGEQASLYVAFLRAPPPEERWAGVLELRNEVDDFHLRGREVYWLCRTRSSDSAFSGAVLEKRLGMPATFRNVNTVRRLADRYGAPR